MEGENGARAHGIGRRERGYRRRGQERTQSDVTEFVADFFF